MYWTLAIAFIIGSFFATKKRYRWFYILYKTFRRDVIGGYRFLKINYTIYQWEKNRTTIPKLFTELVKKHPDKVAFYFENEAWTYKQLEEFSNQVANYFKEEGYKKGDTIALVLENRPEYVGIWLGLSKIGVITALINTNLISDPLFHSISVAKSKAVIYGSNNLNAVNDIKNKLGALKLYVFNTLDSKEVLNGSIDLQPILKKQSAISPKAAMELTTPRDKVVYIFTSGTTGLPKAAVISHSRFMFTVIGINVMINLTEKDIYYNPLPLYHSAGGMIAVGQSLMFGVSVVIRKKFSASNFWTDCNKYNCTVAHYIGEICRYILAAHKTGSPVVHGVKKMVGNGLRPQLWKQFADTFNIEQIYEFYGSTEGNSNLINIDNKIGAVGFVPRYSHMIYPVTLIKCDEETCEPIRKKDGYCVRCKPGEGGIFIGKINPKRSVSEFEGYADKTATSKKIIQNVFKKGDAYFNSGDILVQDEFGYYYFKDRTGDTFRWKGENVATNEIEAVIEKVLGLKESVVYGVEIPGTEGRAGMMAVVDPENQLNKDELSKGLRLHLPSYAIPLFLRVTNSLPMTGTFKVKKVELQNDGFDVHRVNDPLYFHDLRKGAFIPLSDVYDDIMSGKFKL